MGFSRRYLFDRYSIFEALHLIDTHQQLLDASILFVDDGMDSPGKLLAGRKITETIF